MRHDSFREIVDVSRHAVEGIRPHHEQFLAREQPGETEGAHDFGSHRRFNEAASLEVGMLFGHALLCRRSAIKGIGV